MGEYAKRYKREFDYSYAPGPFPTFELLNASPERALQVYMDEAFNEREKLASLCAEKGIPCGFDRRSLERISNKDVCYAAAKFRKYECSLNPASSHIVLVNPSDMGNLGTIMRTLLGLGIKDLAIIEPSADIFNPKTVRASMGALFRLRFSLFASFSEYMEGFGAGREIFTFMLDGGSVLTPEICPAKGPFSLVFGNEASGLPEEFKSVGTSVFIRQSPDVDSLNLAMAVGIGTYIFTQRSFG